MTQSLFGKPSEELREALRMHLAGFGSVPFLFVGSGLSRRYLGLETWKCLLRRFSQGLPHGFQYYLSKAGGDLPMTASLMAADFHGIWFASDAHKESREEFGETITDQASPLKVEISRFMRGLHIRLAEPDVAEEVEALRAATVDGIITTNWDRLLEIVFGDFQVFKGQEELLFAQPQAIAEIYKIHGCCSQPNSLVLTTEDYADYNQRNAYLAAKLLTVFIEHPVIFLGYSLSDPNVISILESITKCLGTKNLQQLGRNLILVEWDEAGESTIQQSVLSLRGHTLPVTVVKTGDFLAVYQSLKGISRKFPAKLLRQLKTQVYELVRTNDPHGQMHVRDIEEDTDPSRLQVVYGVGIVKAQAQPTPADAASCGTLPDVGYQRFLVGDVIRDVVFGDHGFDPGKVARITLPELLGPSKYVPVFKYLRAAGFGDASDLSQAGFSPRVVKAAGATPASFRDRHPSAHRQRQAEKLGGIGFMREHCKPSECVRLILYLDPGLVLIREFEAFLKEEFATLVRDVAKVPTEMKRLVCLYDIYRAGPIRFRTA